MTDSSRLYERELPGGGYVRIDGYQVSENEFRATLRVERRGDPTRRFAHPPPAILECSGRCREDALSQLIGIAEDNVALASAILSWRSTHANEELSGY